MDNLRMEQLRNYWQDEPLCGDGWREELTPEELDCVAEWDRAYTRDVRAIASVFLIQEKVRERFSPAEILELETLYDHCRLRLRDGRMFLARLDQNRDLKLDEIDEVC